MSTRTLKKELSNMKAQELKEKLMHYRETETNYCIMNYWIIASWCNCGKTYFYRKKIQLLKILQFSSFCGIILIQLDSTNTGLTLVQVSGSKQ